MKKIFMLFFLLLFLSTAIYAQSQAGRYQLSQGYYKSYVDSEGNQGLADEKTIFRIDTVTGKTWKFVAGLANNKIINRWDLISEE